MRVHYEWLSEVCHYCCMFGHDPVNCPRFVKGVESNLGVVDIDCHMLVTGASSILGVWDLWPYNHIGVALMGGVTPLMSRERATSAEHMISLTAMLEMRSDVAGISGCGIDDPLCSFHGVHPHGCILQGVLFPSSRLCVPWYNSSPNNNLQV